MTDCPDIEVFPSPNFSSRAGFDVIGTVIHYTADGPEWNPIRWLTMPESQASAHFVIERDGDIYRLVRLTKKAWHAGKSLWVYGGKPRRDVSRYTIGIELANAGRLTRSVDGKFFWEVGRQLRPYCGPKPVQATLEYDSGHKVTGWWEPYPDAQIEALQSLLRKLKRTGYKEAACNIVGHEEISGPNVRGSERFKTDPGPLFPWDRLARDSDRTMSSVLIP